MPVPPTFQRMVYEARTFSRDDFRARHPDPVLLALELADGDLHHEDTDDDGTNLMGAPHPRTLLHRDRKSLRERLFGAPGTEGPTERLYLAIRGTAMVGRDETRAELVVDDPSVSKRHGRVDFIPVVRRFTFTDLDSSNGSFHNGIRLMPNDPTPLNPGDELRLGRVIFAFLTAGAFYDALSR